MEAVMHWVRGLGIVAAMVSVAAPGAVSANAPAPLDSPPAVVTTCLVTSGCALAPPSPISALVTTATGSLQPAGVDTIDRWANAGFGASAVANSGIQPAATLPDLTVSWEGIGPSGSDTFAVVNRGGSNAGPFRVAVLASAQSFSFNESGLAAGTRFYASVPGLSCGQAVLVIADVDNAVHESNKQNNTSAFLGSCPIDGGSQGVAASN